MTDTLDHYGLAGWLAKAAIEEIDALTVYESFEGFALEYGYDGIELSDADVSRVQNILSDIAYHMS